MIRLSFQALGPGRRWGDRSQTVEVWRMDADRGGARPDATLPVATIRPAVPSLAGPQDWSLLQALPGIEEEDPRGGDVPGVPRHQADIMSQGRCGDQSIRR